MTFAQALQLLGMLTDTVTAQREQIDQLQQRLAALVTPDPEQES